MKSQPGQSRVEFPDAKKTAARFDGLLARADGGATDCSMLPRAPSPHRVGASINDVAAYTLDDTTEPVKQDEATPLATVTAAVTTISRVDQARV